MLEASIDPSDAPAPTSVWISSIKRTILPSDRSISFKIFLRRSSNSPRYFVPAISEPRSRETSSLSLRDSGTSPCDMRMARPSTMAVFPTPASPIKIGLFLVRRERIWMTRRISLSRPITGSSLFSLASLVRLRAYFERVRIFFGLSSAVSSLFLSSSMIPMTAVRSILNRARTSRAWLCTSKHPTKRCSVEINSSLSVSATFPACSIIDASSGVR